MKPDDQLRSAWNCVAVNAIIDAGVVEDPSISRQSLHESVCHRASVKIGMDKSDNQRQRADDMQLADDVKLNVPEPGCRFSAAVKVGMNHISRQRDVIPDARMWSSSALAPSMTVGQSVNLRKRARLLTFRSQAKKILNGKPPSLIEVRKLPLLKP
jgi:hypothetical protein